MQLTRLFATEVSSYAEKVLLANQKVDTSSFHYRFHTIFVSSLMNNYCPFAFAFISALNIETHNMLLYGAF